MLSFQYTYLFGTILFFIYWIILFLCLKEYRRRLLLFSFIYGALGVVFGFVYTVDWWQPATVLGYRVGVEDFLLGFTNGGISAIAYLLFLKNVGYGNPSIPRLISPILITGFVTIFLFYFFSISSFYANCIGIVASILYIVIQRKDLFKVSLLSGLIMLISSLPVYLLMIFVSPGWVEETWMLENLSGILWLGIPAEDFVWYFLVGMVISIIYPYYKEEYF